MRPRKWGRHSAFREETKIKPGRPRESKEMRKGGLPVLIDGLSGKYDVDELARRGAGMIENDEMNVVFLAVHENVEGLRGVAEQMKRSARIKVEFGVVAAVGAKYLDAEMTEVVQNLANLFGGGAFTYHARGAANLPLHLRFSTVVADFLLTFFTMFPGPWLVVPEGAEVGRDWYLGSLKQHRRGGGLATGRFVSCGGGKIPVGPFVLESGFDEVRVFSHVLAESWLWRGRHWFARNGVEARKWAFSKEGEKEAGGENGVDTDAGVGVVGCATEILRSDADPALVG